ncbi:MAG: glycerophosphodiester phosphodiesterase family protein [Acidimicrobiales bacterium]
MGHPSRFRHPFLNEVHPIAFAHRGGASEAPENSLAAFKNAVSLGYQFLETDVHATSDGILVAFHDDRLDRLTDSHGIINELTYEEVSQALIDGREPIPTLRELLLEFPDAFFNIDAKHESSVDHLAALLTELDCLDRVLVASFSSTRLTEMRSWLGPRLATSMGSRGVGLLLAAAAGFPTGRLKAVATQLPRSLFQRERFARRILRAAHKREVAVHVWTVDDPEEMNYLLDLGVDGIMSDEIQVLKQVFQKRGIWSP